MGNLYQTRKNKIPIQPTPYTSADKEYDPTTPEALHISNTETTYPIFSAIEKMGRVYNDQKGQLPITSRKENKCDSLLYYYDAIAILIDTLNKRTRQ